MRIQHNIMSMNAYRNYNNNTSALSKNLEKLSSGYKINRAGDDAAGLAISEKMRAQIKGLEAARKNVKDGISLVKTAEGAMQEIQDMLSRMKYLATQSANGTYDDDVDRNALQNEVDQLNSEINRIADSANFNGTKLLDGSLSGGGASTSTTKAAAPDAAGFTFTTAAGSKAKAEFSFTDITGVGLGDVNLNATVNGKVYTVNLQVRKTSAGDKVSLFNGDKALGTAVALTTLGNVPSTGLTIKASDIAKLLSDKISADLGGNATVTPAAGKITIEAAEVGANTIYATGGSVNYKKADGVTDGSKAVAATNTAGKDIKYTITNGSFKNTAKASAIADTTYVLNGVKFAFMTDAKEINKITDKSINIIQLDGTVATNAAKIAAQLNQLTGLDMSAKTSDGSITFRTKLGGSTGGSGGGLKLQIGDTGDGYNQLSVVVKDLHAAAIGCAGVDISSIGGAQAAIDTVKDCINYVSEIRGKLGATQNRLEHTANNLSVMQENIQDAESTIRDTDVADEMMAYTKNNILIQSAQAMLAQANSVPQGVLQLLQ